MTGRCGTDNREVLGKRVLFTDQMWKVLAFGAVTELSLTGKCGERGVLTQMLHESVTGKCGPPISCISNHHCSRRDQEID